MTGLPRRGGVTPRKTGSRLALIGVALVLSVGVSLALESSVALEHSSSAVGAQVPVGATAGATLTAAVAPAASGSQVEQGDRNVRNNQQRRSQPLSPLQARTLVQRRYSARVVRTHTLQGYAGRALYEFRLLSASGTVWTVRIDAASGTEVP